MQRYEYTESVRLKLGLGKTNPSSLSHFTSRV